MSVLINIISKVLSIIFLNLSFEHNQISKPTLGKGKVHRYLSR